MRATGLLLLLAAAARGTEVELPLGNLVRPGLPVVVASRTAVEVLCGDWSFPIDGTGLVVPPSLPSGLRDTEGALLATLVELPADELLVGLVGDVRADLEQRLGAGLVARIRLEKVPPDCWQALDHFDRIVLPDASLLRAGGEAALATWVQAGGEVVGVGWDLQETGLGSVVSGADLEDALRRAGPAAPLLVPRPGAARPELYDLVPEPVGPSAALVAARWVVSGAALAMLVQLLLGALGLVRPPILIGGLAVIAVLAALIGLLRTRSDYRPVLSGRIQVDYRSGTWGRSRVYHVHWAVGPGARVPVAKGAVPVFFRPADGPWWQGPGRICVLEPGTVRIFRFDLPLGGAAVTGDGLEPVLRPGSAAARARPVLRLLEGARPARERWAVAATRGLAAPGDDDPLLARLALVAQR